MSGFWLKLAGVIAAVFVVLIVLTVIPQGEDEPAGQTRQPEQRTVYDAFEEDEERLDAPIKQQELAKANEPNQQQASEQARQQVAREQPEPQPEQPQQKSEQQDQQPQFRELSRAEEADAEKLWQMAKQQRKMGRLPGMTFGQAVQYARDIIEKYPKTEYAMKARRLLADLPYNAKQRYEITKEEMGPFAK